MFYLLPPKNLNLRLSSILLEGIGMDLWLMVAKYNATQVLAPANLVVGAYLIRSEHWELAAETVNSDNLH